ncbi:MAG: PTS sugar transporter subunit IIC [Atopobiaceae bacterium]|nr:PTS sugar transporter subunit IIC [Atopobiaceae bacterium]
MEALLAPFQFISDLGANVMMPIILTIFGCVLGAGFGKSLRAGLTVGVGFIGLNLVIGQVFGGQLVPAVSEMCTKFGLTLDVVDVGWPAAAAIAFASQVGVMIIPLGLVVNIVMILTGTTQTVDVDIWDYWHFAFTGALVAAATNNIMFGFLAAIFNMMIIMVLGDYTAPLVQESLGIPGISLPHGFSTAYAPIAMLFNKIFDMIPGVRDIDINTESLQKQFGVFGEPLLLGTVMGIIIGCLAYFDPADIRTSIITILNLGVQMGAGLVLIPRMAALLMEGLVPISEAANKFVSDHFKGAGKIYIGLDSAVGVGHPVTLAIALVLVPACIFLAVALPGNRVLPFADLAVIPWMFVLITPVVHNNGFRGIVSGLIILTVGLYIATDLAPTITTVAASVGFDMAGASAISSICDGANPLTWIIFRLFGLNPIVGIAVVGAVSVAMAIWNRNRIKKEAAELNA